MKSGFYNGRDKPGNQVQDRVWIIAAGYTVSIDGDMGWYHTTLGNDLLQEQLRTIAHEVGHCIVGEGHADTGDAAVKLKGFNPSSMVQERLMVSGDLTRKPVAGYRLVKGEWDEAEKWMRKFVDPPTQ